MHRSSQVAGTSQSPSSTADIKSPAKALTFLEAYESAQKRISDLASHRERVLAEITQPATVIDSPRPERRRSSTKPVEDREADGLTTTIQTPAHDEVLSEVQPTPATVRTSARLRGRRSEAASEPQRHVVTHEPSVQGQSVSRSDSVTPPQLDEETEEEDDEGSAEDSEEESEEVCTFLPGTTACIQKVLSVADSYATPGARYGGWAHTGGKITARASMDSRPNLDHGNLEAGRPPRFLRRVARDSLLSLQETLVVCVYNVVCISFVYLHVFR